MLTAISAALGQAWNITGGFGGLTSFGHAAFFGFGAYGAAILQHPVPVLNPWFGSCPLGADAGRRWGQAMGWASFRAGLRGSYFALATLAFAEAFRVIANSAGLHPRRAGPCQHRRLHIREPPRICSLGTVADFLRGSCSSCLVLADGLRGLASAWLTRSRFGAQLIAALGAKTRTQPRALGRRISSAPRTSPPSRLSGGLTALGGVVYAQTYLYVDPSIAFGSRTQRRNAAGWR